MKQNGSSHFAAVASIVRFKNDVAPVRPHPFGAKKPNKPAVVHPLFYWAFAGRLLLQHQNDFCKLLRLKNEAGIF